MGNLIRKYDEADMMQTLRELLFEGETITAAVYCAYKATGFFAPASNVRAGYAALTDRDRLIGYQFGLLGSEPVAMDLNYLTKLKVSGALFGQKNVYMQIRTDRKYEVKFQFASKITGASFPNQKQYAQILTDELTARQNQMPK